MQALRFEQGALKLAEVPPVIRPGEARVRVTLAGICNTDVEIVRGYANFSGTLGHEFVGVVEASPDPQQIGQRVVGEINVGCGLCAPCQQQDARHCAQRNVLGIRQRDGAFAEYLSLPPQNLLPVPAQVSDRAAVFTEPLAAAHALLEQVSLSAAQRVAVIGDGKLGQLIARVLATTGCDLLLIGKHQDKLELAARVGIQGIELVELRARGLREFDYVIEASGAASGFDLALDLVKPRGTVILKSTFHGALTFDSARLVVNEITVRGSRCGRFAPALALLANGQVEVESLIAQEFALRDGVAALQQAQQPGILKVLLRP